MPLMEGQEMKRIVLLLGSLCLVVMIAAMGAWIPRRNCLCFRSVFAEGKQLPIDAALLEHCTPREGTFQRAWLECEHGMKIRLFIQGTEYYTCEGE